MVHVPVSIHELDTTPRDTRTVQQTTQAVRTVVASAPPPSPYEITNPEDSDKPKGGWWRKLTGQ
jgi:hypothetical protein